MHDRRCGGGWRYDTPDRRPPGEPYPEVERSFDNYPRATLGPDDRTIDWAGAAIHSRDPDATLAKAGRNLTTAGWQVHPTSSGRITATKADVTVRVWTDGHTVLFAFTRREPPAVPLLAAGGALLGGLLAWLLTCWAARRVLTAPQPVQSTTAALAVIGLTMLLPVLVALGPTIIAEYLPIDPIPLPVATIIGTPFPTITAITAAGLLAEVIALLLAALSSGRPGAHQLGGTPADG